MTWNNNASMSQQPVMMDELRCHGCNYLLNPYAQECPKCRVKVDPLDQGLWFLRSAASTVLVLVWAGLIYFGLPIPPWTIIPVGIVALALVVRERSAFKAALRERSKRLDELARMSGQFDVVKDPGSADKDTAKTDAGEKQPPKKDEAASGDADGSEADGAEGKKSED